MLSGQASTLWKDHIEYKSSLDNKLPHNRIMVPYRHYACANHDKLNYENNKSSKSNKEIQRQFPITIGM